MSSACMRYAYEYVRLRLRLRTRGRGTRRAAGAKQSRAEATRKKKRRVPIAGTRHNSEKGRRGLVHREGRRLETHCSSECRVRALTFR